MTPRIQDDDKDTITITVPGRGVVRSWNYLCETDRRQKMMRAHEFAEGWYQARKAMGAVA